MTATANIIRTNPDTSPASLDSTLRSNATSTSASTPSPLFPAQSHSASLHAAPTTPTNPIHNARQNHRPTYFCAAKPAARGSTLPRNKSSHCADSKKNKQSCFNHTPHPRSIAAIKTQALTPLFANESQTPPQAFRHQGSATPKRQYPQRWHKPRAL